MRNLRWFRDPRGAIVAFGAEIVGRALASNAIDGRFNAVDAQFAEVNRRLDSLGEKLDAFARALTGKMDSIDGRFDAVERRIDSVEHNLTARLDRHFELFHSEEARLNDLERIARG